MRPLTTLSSGHDIDLYWPDLSPLGIEQVAHSLAHINRFSGHALRAISVAEHSLMVCEILDRHLQVRSPSVLLAGLMHDAHECLTGDVTSPMKALLGEEWKAAELRIQRQVLKHFECWTAFSSNHLLITEADRHALSAEREQLMPLGQTWPVQITHPAPTWCVYPLTPSLTADDWREAFTARFTELQTAREAQNDLINHKD